MRRSTHICFNRVTASSSDSTQQLRPPLTSQPSEGDSFHPTHRPHLQARLLHPPLRLHHQAVRHCHHHHPRLRHHLRRHRHLRHRHLHHHRRRHRHPRHHRRRHRHLRHRHLHHHRRRRHHPHHHHRRHNLHRHRRHHPHHHHRRYRYAIRCVLDYQKI
ncbi:hypothetical protein EQVG_00305 [Emiliania huxleyi virus 207]|nr:hypothetical protein EQVG_00305 [Emiliania huxleyi virus 207]